MTVGDWTTRVAPSIRLVSPLGSVIEAKWKGDSLSISKNIQRDKFPLIAGEYGKDLGSGAEEYSINLYFDGTFCDLKAKDFLNAVKQIGTWTVTHPVHGVKTLILIRVKHNNNPVESGGVEEFETEWFEPLDLLSILSGAQLASLVAGLADSVCVVSATSFNFAKFFLSAGNITAALSMASVMERTIIEGIPQSLWIANSLAETSPLAQEQYDLAKASLDDQIAAATANADDFDAEAISLGLSGMMQATTLGAVDGEEVIDMFDTMADTMIALLPSGAARIYPSDANKAATIQTALEGAMAAVCSGMAFASRETRTQAVDAAQRVAALFSKIVKAIDLVTAEFDDLRADRQYYGQTETFGELKNMVDQTVKFLLRQTFDLAIEKRFTLEEDKSPIQICYEEFGPDGENRFNDFIDWNQLEYDEILILPAGREVAVYVEPV